MNYLRPVLLFVFLSLVGAGIFFGGYMLDIAPLEHQLSAQQQMKLQLTTQLQREGYQQIQREEKTIRLPEVKKLLQTWQARFVKPQDVDNLLKMINEMGRAHQLQFGYFGVEPKQADAYYIWVPVKISAAGKFVQMIDFVEEISQLPWIVVIKNFELRELDQVPTFSMEMELEIFSLRS